MGDASVAPGVLAVRLAGLIGALSETYSFVADSIFDFSFIASCLPTSATVRRRRSL